MSLSLAVLRPFFHLLARKTVKFLRKRAAKRSIDDAMLFRNTCPITLCHSRKVMGN